MCRSVEGVNGRAGRLLDWLAWISKVAMIPIATLALWAWWNHEERIDAVAVAQQIMSGNRMTSGDGLEVWREIASIRADIEGKADAIGAEPVREDIREIKDTLRDLERLLMTHIATHDTGGTR